MYEKTCSRGNQIPFITKDLSKSIMKRSRLRITFLKTERRKIKPYIQNIGTTPSQF